MVSKQWGLCSLAAAAMLIGVSGCESSGTSSGSGTNTQPSSSADAWRRDSAYSIWDRGTPAPAPRAAAPAPAAKPAEQPVAKAAPAPAPQPRRTGACRDYRPNAGAQMSVNSMAFPTGDVNTSGLLTHIVMPREVRAGQSFEYEIHATNVTSGSLENVVVSADSMNNMNMTGATPTAGRSAAGGAQWALGNLASCETKVIKATGTAGTTGSTGFCVSASYLSSLCATANVVQPALAITKTMTPPSGTVCDNYSMTIEVTNTGSGTASNVKVADTFPAGLTADNQAAWNMDIGNLAGGQKWTRTVPIKVSKSGKYDNFATATADGGLTVRSQTASISATQPVLQITTECSGQMMINRNGSCKITVRNAGDGAAANTVVTAPVPSGTSFVSADMNGTQSGGRISWNLGTLAPGESKTISQTYRSTGAGTVTCAASATATCAAAVNSECKHEVRGVADIGTLVTDNDGVTTVGDNHIYTLEVKNQGQVDLTNVKMTLVMPAEISMVSSTKQPTSTTGNKLTFDFGTVPVGQAREIKVTVKSSKAGEYLVTGETTCTEIRQPVRDDELTVFVER